MAGQRHNRGKRIGERGMQAVAAEGRSQAGPGPGGRTRQRHEEGASEDHRLAWAEAVALHALLGPAANRTSRQSSTKS